jgi:hypothetical protein
MSISAVGVTEGSDKYLHTNQRSIGGTAREEQATYAAQSPNATYTAVADDVSTATANAHLLQIMADGTNYSRLVGFTIEPTENGPASDSILKVALYRLTTAGSGGSSIGEGAYDDADSYSGDIQSLPSTKGTEGALLWTGYLPLDAAYAGFGPRKLEWSVKPYAKPIIFGVDTADGLAFKVIDAVASAAVCINAEFVTTSYL